MSEPAIQLSALRIFMQGLVVQAEIGVYRHEKGRRQPLVVDAEVELAPNRVEGLEGTYNYETLSSEARRIADAGHIDLVETYAQSLAAACLSDPRVQSVRIRVEKPEALKGARAGVEIVARRE